MKDLWTARLKGEIEYVPWPPDYERVETGDVGLDIGKLQRRPFYYLKEKR